jgi:hypothetical protein
MHNAAKIRRIAGSAARIDVPPRGARRREHPRLLKEKP